MGAHVYHINERLGVVPREISPRSEKMDKIRDTRSLVLRVQLINSFQAGGSLHTREQ